GTSSLTTLDGGPAQGYTAVLPAECVVAMQLCPSAASTWRDNPHLSALIGSAYAACGEAGSALHAMALLQVNQAQALKDLYESGHDPEVLKELRIATDLALHVTKVTARSLLCLVDIRETDKTRFLNAPVSQTGLFGDTVENFAQQFSAAQKQTEAIRHILHAPQPARCQGRPPASAPAQASQQPSQQRRGAGRRAAAPPVQAPTKTSGKQKSNRDGWSCSLGDGEHTRGGVGRANLGLHSPSSLANERQWAVGECYQTYYSRTICPNAGKCLTHSRHTHSDPASDWQRDARAGSMRSPSLPHCGCIGGPTDAACTLSWGLDRASQSILLAPLDHQTWLCDSVRRQCRG
ncbi:hypothetical protein M9458_025012, partial [Cirrhinus mrigala]